MTLILKTLSVSVLAFWLVSLGYLAGECYGTGYDGTIWEWQYLGVDHWTAFSTIESCMSWEVSTVVGEDGVRMWWNMPLLGVLLWWLGSLLSRPSKTRYSESEIQDIRDKARRSL